ncbi:hypothetical protein LINPERPRIM_LOCUS1963 [Linum perenne]
MLLKKKNSISDLSARRDDGGGGGSRTDAVVLHTLFLSRWKSATAGKNDMQTQKTKSDDGTSKK